MKTHILMGKLSDFSVLMTDAQIYYLQTGKCGKDYLSNAKSFYKGS